MDGDVWVVDNGAEVFFAALFAVFHFFDGEVSGRQIGQRGAACFVDVDVYTGVLGGGFKVDVQIAKLLSSLGKGEKVVKVGGKGDARQFFGQVMRPLGSVIRAVQNPVDIVKNLVFADFLGLVVALELFQRGVGNAVFLVSLFVVEVAGKALTFFDAVQRGDLVGHQHGKTA